MSKALTLQKDTADTKANHATMVVVAIVIMVVCMLFETMLILGYNKKNKMLLDNESKF